MQMGHSKSALRTAAALLFFPADLVRWGNGLGARERGSRVGGLETARVRREGWTGLENLIIIYPRWNVERFKGINNDV